MRECVIQQGFVGLLYEDGAYKRTLEPGRHRFKGGFFGRLERTVRHVDLRERSLTIKGQEILTADKVAVRVSLLVYFKVKDAVAAAHNVALYEERIYEDVQLAARRFLASRNLDAILSGRNEISDAVRDEVKEAAEGYGVEILRADVKDLVFPGNLREIMNQVLETERKAEAKLIEARKEAEAARLKGDADNEARIRKLESEKEEMRLRSEAEREAIENRLKAQLEEARAVAETPQLLKLRQLEVLKELAVTGGGKLIIGLKPDDLSSLIAD
jgi:regulator of protease activity HflC (stomatin/prohibitin superfamily)